jgi:hypothetical protein
MPSHKKKKSVSGTTLKEMVTIAFAEDIDLAKQYKQLLLDNEIPAAIQSCSSNESEYKGIPVMVPEDYIDEAHMLIEAQSSMGDFYNEAFSEDDHDDIGYEPEFYDDEF